MTHLSYKHAKFILLASLVVFALALGTPILGVGLAHSLAAALGCPLSNTASQCAGLGGFMNTQLQPYNNLLIANLLTPLVFVWVFWPLLIVWVGAALVCATLQDHREPKSAKRYPPRI